MPFVKRSKENMVELQQFEIKRKQNKNFQLPSFPTY